MRGRRVPRRAIGFLLAAVWLAAGMAGAAAGQGLPGSGLVLKPDSSGAAPPPALATPGLEAPVDPASYVLGPGDGLMLEVLGRINMSVPLEVDPEGDVWVPDYGPRHLAGRTLAEARTELGRAFHAGARGLEVHVRLVRLRRILVFIEGEVVHPGGIQTTAVTRLSEAIRQAGGLTERASRRNIRMLDPGDSVRTADLLRFARLGDSDANPRLQAGDRVIVPVARLPVYLHAPVPYPGGIEYRPGETLGELIRIAGGFLPTAVPEQGRVLRFRDRARVDTLAVDLGLVMRGQTDLDLQEGDRIFVPSTSEYHEDRSVTVRGEVVHPGVYAIDEGADRVSDALRFAGGMTPQASPSGILVVRQPANTLERDPEFDRLSRLSRGEMTDAEYQTFRTKLASAQNTFRVEIDAIDAGDRPPGAPSALLARDALLRSGDVVVVEREHLSVQVAGEVRRPGLVDYDPARRGEDYIRLAGGFTQKAKHSGVRITRVATGQTLLLKDVKRVEPGDLIYVPDKRDINWFGVLRDVVALATSIATLVVVSRR